MVTKVIELQHDLLKKALENPNKNFVWVFGNDKTRRKHFADMADEVCAKLMEFPIMISAAQSRITMPEGGRILLRVMNRTEDVGYIQGIEIMEYVLHDSFYAAPSHVQHHIEMWLKSRRRQ